MQPSAMGEVETYESIVVMRLVALFVLWVVVLFAANEASTRQAERIKKARAKRKPKTRVKKRIYKAATKKSKAPKKPRRYKAPALSEEQKRLHLDYIIKRDKLAVKPNIPQ